MRGFRMFGGERVVPQGRPLDDATIAAILASIDAGKSRNQVAREHQVSASTVSRIAASNARAFDRSKTKNATEAAKADNAALRAATSRRLLVKANELLDQMDQEHVAFNFGGKDNTYNEKTLKRPPVSDLRNLMTAAAVAVDKHLVIERHDSGTGAEQAASLLGSLFEQIQERHGSAPE